MRDLPLDPGDSSYNYWITHSITQTHEEFFSEYEYCNSFIKGRFNEYFTENHYEGYLSEHIENLAIFNHEFKQYLLNHHNYEFWCIIAPDGIPTNPNIHPTTIVISQQINEGWNLYSPLDAVSDVFQEVGNYVLDSLYWIYTGVDDLVQDAIDNVQDLIEDINCPTTNNCQILFCIQWEVHIESSVRTVTGWNTQELNEFRDTFKNQLNDDVCSNLSEDIVCTICNVGPSVLNIFANRNNNRIDPGTAAIAVTLVCNILKATDTIDCTPPLICQDGTEVQNIQDCPEQKNYLIPILIGLGLYAFAT